MDSETFVSNLKYMAQNGVTLNVDEKMNVSLSIQQLKLEMGFEETLFWGKVEGMLYISNSFCIFK